MVRKYTCIQEKIQGNNVVQNPSYQVLFKQICDHR